MGGVKECRSDKRAKHDEDEEEAGEFRMGGLSSLLVRCRALGCLWLLVAIGGAANAGMPPGRDKTRDQQGHEPITEQRR
jgi:hypothetical protein